MRTAHYFFTYRRQKALILIRKKELAWQGETA